MKQCVLYDRECIECGECNMCDLDPTKVCDNCMKCVQTDADYKELVIADILDGEENVAPIPSQIDREELSQAWKALRDSGLWKEEEGEED